MGVQRGRTGRPRATYVFAATLRRGEARGPAHPEATADPSGVETGPHPPRWHSATTRKASYRYVVSTTQADGYAATPNSGTAAVAGANTTVAVTLALVKYGVPSEEYGLPIGAAWWVRPSTGLSVRSTSQNLTVFLPTGTYASRLAQWPALGRLRTLGLCRFKEVLPTSRLHSRPLCPRRGAALAPQSSSASRPQRGTPSSEDPMQFSS